MYYRSVSPNDLAEMIHELVKELVATGEQMTPAGALYCEKRGGFQCATCQFATPVNATHGKCKIMQGSIHLEEGCCAAWMPNAALLHLYRQPVEN